MATTEWEVYDEATGLLGAIYGSVMKVRMLAVRLAPGQLLVVSPGSGTSEERFAELEKWGKPTFLLAPNHFHNMGLPQWHARYPEAVVCAHPAALKRLRKKLPGVPLADLTALEAALPSHVRVVHDAHTTQGELLVTVATAGGKAWFVTDSILNEEHLPGGALGFVIWLLGFRKQLMTNPHFRRMYMSDKQAHRDWMLQQLDADQPTLFIPSHGVPLRGPDVTERLRAITVTA